MAQTIAIKTVEQAPSPFFKAPLYAITITDQFAAELDWLLAKTSNGPNYHLASYPHGNLPKVWVFEVSDKGLTAFCAAFPMAQADRVAA